MYNDNWTDTRTIATGQKTDYGNRKQYSLT